EGCGERLVSRKAGEPQSYSMERRTQVGATIASPETAPDRREPESRPTVESKPGRERSTSISRPTEDPGNRRGAKRRRAPKDNDGASTIRYFLTKASSNGTPELDQEMPDEHQALLAAHKADRRFVTV